MTKPLARNNYSNPVEDTARNHELEALAVIVDVMRDPTVKPEYRLRAADSLLDRARGKAKAATPPPPPTEGKKKALQMSTKQLMEIVQAAQAAGRLALPSPQSEPIDVTPTAKTSSPSKQAKPVKNNWARDLDANESST